MRTLATAVLNIFCFVFVPGECRVAFRTLPYDIIMVMWVSLPYFER
jgi:hypothetical protein